MRYIHLKVLITMIAIVMVGCSSGNNLMSPETTDSSYSSIGQFSGNIPVGVTGTFSNGSPAAGMGSLGLFNLHIDPISVSAELTSVRSASLPDVLEVVDITNFLQLAPCTDCAKIQSVSLDDDGNVVVSIGLKHPFEEGDPFKPITGRNRGDLHVFNVEGTIFSNNTAASFPGLGRSVANFRLLNASGYTGYLNPVIDEIYPTSATIHPYILHFDDYSQGNFDPNNPMGFASVTNPPPSGNLVMAMGSDYDFKDYVFALPDEPVDFIYAIGCTYAVSSASKSERFNPEFRVPQHLKKAASEVWVEIVENDLADGDTESSADVEIHVVDRSHGVEVGDGLDQMLAASDVGSILIELPGVMLSPLNIDGASSISGTGHDPSDPLVYRATITNTTGASEGWYQGLIKVIDTYPPGLNESPLLDGMDGIERVDPVLNPLEGLFAIPEFATYQTFNIEIRVIREDPIAVIQTTPDPPELETSMTRIVFDGSMSYNPDGSGIALFEWDFNWDGDPVNFNPDISSDEAVVTHYYRCNPGTYTAALRVTDDGIPARTSEIESVDVNITSGFSERIWAGSTNLGNEFIEEGIRWFMTGDTLHVDSNNVAHIISYDGPYTEGRIHHRTWDGTTLSSPNTISFSYQIRGVTSCLDANDEIHVFWYNNKNPVEIEHIVSVNQELNNNTEVLYTREPGYYMSWLNVESNYRGEILVTWIRAESFVYESAYFMWTFNDGTGSGWTTPEVTTTEIYIRQQETGYHHLSPRLKATPDGKFHLIYYSLKDHYTITVDRALYEQVFDGTEWEPVRTIYYAYPPFNLFVDTDLDGDLHIVGYNSGNRFRYFRYDSSSDTWLPPIFVANNAHYHGDIAVDDGGNIHMVYRSTFDNYHRYRVFCKHDSESSILALPEYMVDDQTVNPNHGDTNLTFDLSGNLLAIYQDAKFLSADKYLYFNYLLYDE